MHGRPPTRWPIALILTASLGRAIAQPAPPPAPDAAEQAYREGRRLYDLREWDEAIAQFKIAYRLRSDAASLFNIAQAYRLKGDCTTATSFYKTYRRNFPAAPNLTKVDKFIAELDTCVKQRASSQQPPQPQPQPQPQPRPQPQPQPQSQSQPQLQPQSQPQGASSTAPAAQPEGTVPVVDGMPGSDSASRSPAGDDHAIERPPAFVPVDADPGRPTRNTGLMLAGAGAVVTGAGVVFALRAASKSSEVSNGHGVWDPELEAAGKRDQAIAIGLIVGGGAALAAGGVIYILGLRQHVQPTSVAVTPRAGGASVVWSCAF